MRFAVGVRRKLRKRLVEWTEHFLASPMRWLAKVYGHPEVPVGIGLACYWCG